MQNTNDLSIYHNYVGIKKQQSETKEKRRKEVINIRAEINETAKKCTKRLLIKTKFL